MQTFYICKCGASGAATLLRLSSDGKPVPLHFTAQDVPWLLIYSSQHRTNFSIGARFLCGDTWSAYPPVFVLSSCLFRSACRWRPQCIHICTFLCSENTFPHSDRGWRHRGPASLQENRELSLAKITTIILFLLPRKDAAGSASQDGITQTKTILKTPWGKNK